jgi:hypothetical protein
MHTCETNYLPRPPSISFTLFHSPNTKPPSLHSPIASLLFISDPLESITLPLSNNLQRLKRLRAIRRPQTREIPPPVDNSHKSPQHTPANHIKHIMPVILQPTDRDQSRPDQRRETHQDSQMRRPRPQAMRLRGEEETQPAETREGETAVAAWVGAPAVLEQVGVALFGADVYCY